VEARINNLERADVLVFVGLVGERSVNDGCIEMLGISGGKGSFAQFNVVVLKRKVNGI
jgi:hypothetical protein